METEADMTKEDGEISDDSDQYTPLERPANYSATAVPTNRFAKMIESESEDEPQQSSSDSDSDVDVRSKKAKKAKLRIRPMSTLCGNNRRKKYDIWSTRMQEDVLSETLNCCDVSLKDRSRDVETYDYTLSYSYKNQEEKKNEVPSDNRTNNKRTHNDRKNSNIRLKGNKNDDAKESKGAPRTLIDLSVTVGDPFDDIVKDIANKLCEEKDDLIRLIVTVAGPEKAIAVFKEVQKIELEGGMLIMNQTRRRTPGGVYFFLVKHDSQLTKEQQNEIFGDAKQKYYQELKERKKKRKSELKAQIMSQRKNKQLPELLSRAELCVQKLATISDRSRKETSNEDVINPPPTPETDGHENDNSADGMDNFNSLTNIVNGSDSLDSRKLLTYSDDFLDITGGNEMDLF